MVLDVFITKYKLFFCAIHGHQPFGHWKNWIKGLHSLNHIKKKPIYQFNRKVKKSAKLIVKKNVEPKIYMRDIIIKIYNVLRYSTWDSAQEQLEKLNIRWDSYTINQVLKTHPPMEKSWLFFIWAFKIKGFKHDQFTYTTMLDIFGEAGRITSMKYVYQQMQEKGIKIDAVTYTSLLHWLSKYGDIDGSVNLWKEMKVNGCFPTVVSYTAYMKVLFDHNRVKEATEVYKEMLQSGCSPNCHTYTVLMEHLAGCGNYEATLEIFDKMQEAGVLPDKATCNILIKKCCKSGEARAMTHILQYMKINSLVLREPVYHEALETLNNAGESDLLLRQANPHFSVELISKGEQNGVEANSADSCLNIDRGLSLMFLERKNFVALDHLLAGMMYKNSHFDPAIISTIIEMNCAQCRTSGALVAFEYSVKMGINIDRTAYLALVGALIRTNTFLKVVEIVKEMERVGHSLGTYLAALLIYRLGNGRRPVSAAKIFDLLPDCEKNSATYTALIAAYFNVGSFDKGLKIYESMQSKGIKPALGTYNVLLGGLQKGDRVAEVEKHRKEKKILQTSIHSQDIVYVEEKICNLLFAGDAVS